MKYAGVPVLESVAAIFAPTNPDFPIPEIITRPFEAVINESAGSILLSNPFDNLVRAAISISSAFFAELRAFAISLIT